MDHDPGDFKYCPYCAVALVLREDGLRDRLACPACDYIYYHNPVAAAGGVIMRSDRICLVRRAISPRKGDWTLPAGFVEYEEPPDVCACREIAEETGLQAEVDGVLGVYAGLDDPRHHVVLVIYRMRETQSLTPVAGDDADAVGFFGPKDIPSNIAFRAHRWALRDVYGDQYAGK